MTSRAASVPQAGDCPNVMTLTRYVSGALDEHIAEDVAGHLAACSRCQNRVDDMSRQPDTLIGAIRRTNLATERLAAVGRTPDDPINAAIAEYEVRTLPGDHRSPSLDMPGSSGSSSSSDTGGEAGDATAESPDRATAERQAADGASGCVPDSEDAGVDMDRVQSATARESDGGGESNGEPATQADADSAFVELQALIAKVEHLGDPDDTTEVKADDSVERPRRKPATLDGFVFGLRNCGLIEDAEITRLLTAIQATDADELARELVDRDVLTSYQARAISRSRWKGLVLGNYEIIDKLGKGGMGQVYKARHRRMNRIVCLKVLRLSGRRSPQVVERFRREVRALSVLSHPNFVVAHDADEDEGIQFLVMEYVEGRDLARVVQEDGPLPVSDVVHLMRQVARALAHAHQQGVIHRDIKPHNLLLTPPDDDLKSRSGESDAGQIKVLDMGLARFDPFAGGGAPDSDSLVAMTATGVIMGTVDYMSPEQAVNSRHADARSDIYSLGCTMFYLLTGRAMFAGETLMEKIVAHREQPRPSLRDEVPEVSLALEAVYRRMVARYAHDRYWSMGALADDLDAVAEGRRPTALKSLWPESLCGTLLDPARWRSEIRKAWDSPSGRFLTTACLACAMLLIAAFRWEGPADVSSAPQETPSPKPTAQQAPAKAKSVDSSRRGTQLSPPPLQADPPPERLPGLPAPRVMVVVDQEGFSGDDYRIVLSHLERHGFEPVTASVEIGQAWPNVGGPVLVHATVDDFNSVQYCGLVFVGGTVTAAPASAKQQAVLHNSIRAALTGNRPVAGIGNGMQVINDSGFPRVCSFQRKGGMSIGQSSRFLGPIIKVPGIEQIPQFGQHMQDAYEAVRQSIVQNQ